MAYETDRRSINYHNYTKYDKLHYSENCIAHIITLVSLNTRVLVLSLIRLMDVGLVKLNCHIFINWLKLSYFIDFLSFRLHFIDENILILLVNLALVIIVINLSDNVLVALAVQGLLCN